MAHLKEFVGKRFGHLVIQSFAGWKNHTRLWKCICDCGTKIILDGENLERGKPKSCGCARDQDSSIFKENAFKRAMNVTEKTKTCWIWNGLFRKDVEGFYPYFNYHRKQYHPVDFFKLILMGKGKKKRSSLKRTCSNPKCVNPDHYQESPISKVRDQEIKKKDTNGIN